MSADYDWMRYREHASHVRLSMVLPGVLTSYEGELARVVETRDLDSGDIAVVLDVIGGKVHHVGGPPEATLLVFADPHPVCSCHGQPWPCNEVWGRQVAQREARREREINLRKCFACGQTKNLSGVKHIGVEARRYCRRVACVAEYERANREAHNLRVREQKERRAFADEMNAALGIKESS